MIITKLIGGLGNQMFQYAAGRRAAHFNNTNLKLDIAGYEEQEGITPRKYMLYIFNIKEDFVKPNETQRLKALGRNFFTKFLSKLTKRIIPYYKQSYIQQKFFQFDSNILMISDNTYLEGYWASEKYFKDIKDIIFKEFTLKEKPNKKNKQVLDKIKESNSVSIHFRRGDYVSDKKTQEYHGICSLDYYHKAASIIAGKIRNPYFFVFSDDPNWVMRNFKIKYPLIVVDHNTGKRDCEDLRLMSACKHNIIANSSFSWWGAWLNRNLNKIVIAPKQWFKEKSINTNDLIPKSWTKI